MHALVLDLTLCHCHEVAHSYFGIFGPVGFHIDDFQVDDLPVEAGEQGHEEELLALQPPVTVAVVEHPGVGGGACEHVEVLGARNEPQDRQTAEEDQRMAPGEAEMLVMGGDLLRTYELGGYTESIGDSEERAFVGLIVRVNVGFLRGLADVFSLGCGASDSFFELFSIGVVAISKNLISFVGHCGD